MPDRATDSSEPTEIELTPAMIEAGGTVLALRYLKLLAIDGPELFQKISGEVLQAAPQSRV
jgi:hypothetical protein